MTTKYRKIKDIPYNGKSVIIRLQKSNGNVGCLLGTLLLFLVRFMAVDKLRKRSHLLTRKANCLPVLTAAARTCYNIYGSAHNTPRYYFYGVTPSGKQTKPDEKMPRKRLPNVQSNTKNIIYV